MFCSRMLVVWMSWMVIYLLCSLSAREKCSSTLFSMNWLNITLRGWSCILKVRLSKFLRVDQELAQVPKVFDEPICIGMVFELSALVYLLQTFPTMVSQWPHLQVLWQRILLLEMLSLTQ